MGSKPKASEYKASEAEKISASVAKADHDRFKELYDPLLQTMREASKSTDPTRQLRGRANADTMQALTSNLTFSQTQDLTPVFSFVPFIITASMSTILCLNVLKLCKVDCL